MIDVNRIKGYMAIKGMSGEDMAKTLGVSRKTFARRMQTGVFDSDEIGKIIITLDIPISECMPIFFKNLVT